MAEPTAQIDWQALLSQIDEDLQILELVTGILPDGSAHYAYVSIPPSRYAAFQEAQANGTYDLAHFGTILQHGPGHAPPVEVQQAMEKDYGANHRFAEELAALREQH